MSNDTSAFPPLTSSELTLEKYDYVRPVTAAFVYGINFTVYLQTVRMLWRSRRKNYKHSCFYLGYTTIIMALGLVYLIGITNFGQLENVDHRDYPGGVLAYEQTDFLNPLFFAGSVTFYVVDWFADALLLWRCYIIWKESRLRFVIIVPFLLYLASFILSIFSIVAVHAPNGITAGFNFLLPYFVVSFSTSMTISLLIVTRLLLQRRLIMNVIGKEHTKHYVSIAAVITESAALYAIVYLLFIVPYSLNSGFFANWLDLLGEVQVLAPLLIIYRVALGRAWDSQTTASLHRVSEMQFAAHKRTQVSTNGDSEHTAAGSTTVMNSSYTRAVTSSDLFTKSKDVLRKEDDLNMTFGDNPSGEIHIHTV